MTAQLNLSEDIEPAIHQALNEDIGDGDRNAALVDENTQCHAVLAVGGSTILSGAAWFDAVFLALDPTMQIEWHYSDGQRVPNNMPLCSLQGSARMLLTGERTALNFLQMISGVASATHEYVERIKGTGAVIVDTRKTLPGLRRAQKYAVRCGGGQNNRFGLYDAILIEANHVAAAGSIEAVVDKVRQMSPEMPIKVAVESLDALDQTLEAGVDVVSFDNFATHVLTRAVNKTKAHRQRFRRDITIEASGDISLRNVREIADTGVDRIAIDNLTRHIRAVDYTIEFNPD